MSSPGSVWVCGLKLGNNDIQVCMYSKVQVITDCVRLRVPMQPPAAKKRQKRLISLTKDGKCSIIISYA